MPRAIKAPWKLLTRTQRSAELRRRATPEELKLLAVMQADPRLQGRFKFQAHLLGHYPDFMFRSAKLIIELDGSVHRGPTARLADARRTRKFTQSGWRVVRFWNSEMRNPQEIVERICAALNQPTIII